MAGSSVTQSISDVRGYGGKLVAKVVTFECVGDDSTGNVPNTAVKAGMIEQLQGWFLYQAKTYFGATPPDDNADFKFLDDDGADLLGGAGLNAIDQTVNNIVYPTADSLHVRPLIEGDITLAVDDASQTVVDALYTIKAVFLPTPAA